MTENLESTKQDIGHWTFFTEFDPECWIGFTYRITNVLTGQQYIGKKFFWSTLRKKVKNRKNRKKVVKPSNWKTYTGSSNTLNADIEKFGKLNFRFEIESLHESRGTLHLTEIEKLISENVLRECLTNGCRKYYNGMVNGIKFIPGPETALEKAHKVRK